MSSSERIACTISYSALKSLGTLCYISFRNILALLGLNVYLATDERGPNFEIDNRGVLHRGSQQSGGLIKCRDCRDRRSDGICSRSRYGYRFNSLSPLYPNPTRRAICWISYIQSLFFVAALNSSNQNLDPESSAWLWENKGTVTYTSTTTRVCTRTCVRVRNLNVKLSLPSR